MTKELSNDMEELMYEMHGDIKRIEQHLAELNGKAVRNEENIDSLEEDVKSNRWRIAMGVGGVSVFSLALTAFVTYIGTAGL